MPNIHLKINMSILEFPSPSQNDQLKFSSHSSVGLLLSFLILPLPTPSSFLELNRIGKREKLPGKIFFNNHVSLSLYSETLVQYFMINFQKENELGDRQWETEEPANKLFHNSYEK